MSVYNIQEPDEEIKYYNKDHEEIKIYPEYSPIQRKRFNKVLYQLKETWYSVYNQFKFMRNNTEMTIEHSNNMMLKIHKLFLIEHKNKIEYYSNDAIMKRKNKSYLKKKIKKLKELKQKL